MRKNKISPLQVPSDGRGPVAEWTEVSTSKPTTPSSSGRPWSPRLLAVMSALLPGRSSTPTTSLKPTRPLSHSENDPPSPDTVHQLDQRPSERPPISWPRLSSARLAPPNPHSSSSVSAHPSLINRDLRRCSSAGGNSNSEDRRHKPHAVPPAASAAAAAAAAASAAAAAAVGTHQQQHSQLHPHSQHAVLHEEGQYRVRGPAPGSLRCGSASSTQGTLLDALTNVVQVANASITDLSHTRAQHEELLQQQREQFQRLMLGLKARSTMASGGGGSAASDALAAPSERSSVASARGSGGFAGGGGGGTALAMAQAAAAAQVTAESATTITEEFRGALVTMPLGCKIEIGQEPGMVSVSGPGVRVQLQFREQLSAAGAVLGPGAHHGASRGLGQQQQQQGGSSGGGGGGAGGGSVVLVSSNCVVTVRKVDGRTHVSVFPPLTRTKSSCG